MSENHLKTTNINLLNEKDAENIRRIHQQVINLVEPYNNHFLKVKQDLAPTLAKVNAIQEQQREILQPALYAIEELQQRLAPIYESISSTLNSLNIQQNPSILQDPASNHFETKVLEEVSSSIELIQKEITDMAVNKQLETIRNTPSKKLTVANIAFCISLYADIASGISSTKDLYNSYLEETNNTQLIEEVSIEQNIININNLEVICPHLDSEGADYEFSSIDESTNNIVNE